ncbi:MAG: hypothetical protein K5917_07100 [Clostridiales bacterium]|nr:hypothetical protein [Clostridiales bacterium]
MLGQENAVEQYCHIVEKNIVIEKEHLDNKIMLRCTRENECAKKYGECINSIIKTLSAK